MKNYLDLEHWPRKEHFNFFRTFDEPFFGATVNIDCTMAYAGAKSAGIPFFVYYLHKTLVAVNAVENFRYRIEGDQIAVYDRIDVSATIGRPDGTFGFSHIVFDPDITVFESHVTAETNRIQQTTGLFTREFKEQNLIHFSALPWLDFTALSHARSYAFPDSCPKISVGKMTEKDGRRFMPFSIHVHHGLVDGLHVGKFVEVLERVMG